MKTSLKALIAALLLSVCAYQAQADSVSVTFTNVQTKVAIATNCIVTSFQLSAPADNPLYLEVYDYVYASTVYTNAAYTNKTVYTTNIVSTLVTEAGVTNTFTNKVLYVDNNIVAASTNTALPVIGSFAVAAGESMVIPGPFVMARGVVLKQTGVATNSVVIVNYHRQ